MLGLLAAYSMGALVPNWRILSYLMLGCGVAGDLLYMYACIYECMYPSSYTYKYVRINEYIDTCMQNLEI